MERRPAGCAENAREMVLKEATQRELEPEPESEQELEPVNTKGLKKTEKEL